MKVNDKERIRQELLVRRRSMDRAEWLARSEAICDRLKELDQIRHAERVHCYVSMENEREVSTLPFLEWLCSERKEVYMPYIEHGTMVAARYASGHCFIAKQIGPPIPDPLVVCDEARFDVVIVPLVGADRRGARIGYGKGWYDRFFASQLSSATPPFKAGICFGFQMVDEVPADPWDQFLDIVVTENGIINCMSARS